MAHIIHGDAALRSHLAVNVKDYGVVGDGVTGDSTALLSALSPNVEVYIPAGSYLLDSVLSIAKAGIRIRGAGVGITKLLYNGSSRPVTFTSASTDAALSDLTIDATGGSGSAEPLLVQAQRFTGERLEVLGQGVGAAFSSAHNSIWRFNKSPVNLTASTDCSITGNEVLTGRLAKVASSSHRCRVTNNRQYNASDTSNSTERGIRISSSNDCLVSGNHLYQSFWHGIAGDSSNNLQVVANRVIRSGRVRADANGTVSAVHLSTCPDSTVVGNYAQEHLGYGYVLAGGSSRSLVEGNLSNVTGDPGLTIQGATVDCALRGNHIYSATYGFTIGEGTEGTNRNTVSDNRFSACPYGGGSIQGGSSNVIRNNHFEDCGYNASVTNWPKCIIILSDGATLGASGNRIEDNVTSRSGSQGLTPAEQNIPWYFVRDDGPTGFTATKTGGNFVQRNRLGGIARGQLGTVVPSGPLGPHRLNALSASSGDDFGVTAEQILSLDSGGSAGSADATNKTEGAASWGLTATSGSTQMGEFTLPANSWSDLSDDAMFELDVLRDATSNNLSSLALRFGQGSSDVNSLSWSFPAAHLESTTAKWFVLRFRKGDATVNGTATWANVTTFRPTVTATGAAGSAKVLLDDLRLVRTS